MFLVLITVFIDSKKNYYEVKLPQTKSVAFTISFSTYFDNFLYGLSKRP
jgi:hypothetical protein